MHRNVSIALKITLCKKFAARTIFAMGGDNIICPICHNDYEDPRILPCGHAVCHDCLQGLLDKDEPSWECPECSTMYIAVDGAKSFPKSKYLLGVMKRGTPTPQNKVRIEKCKGLFTRNRF